MAIIKGKAVDQLLTRPGPNFRAILFYGPNEGRVREYAVQIAKTVVADLSDPFRICQLSAADLKDDPARLADEAAAIAMTGGRRVIRARGIGDAQTDCFANFLEYPQGDSLIVVEAGELAKTSRLRKLFESHSLCAIVACYEDSGADLDALVTGHLRQHGLTINSEAKDYLLHCLGEDRLATRQELDKLVLYKWPRRHASEQTVAAYVIDGKGASDAKDIRDTAGIRDAGDILDIRDTGDIFDTRDIQDSYDTGDVADTADSRRNSGAKDTCDIYDTHDRCVSIEDVRACIGDSSVQGLDGICDALGAGNIAALDNQLARAFEASMAPVAVLRGASNHLLRLQLAAALLAQGNSMDAALRTLRPPMHFSRADEFRKQMRIWSLARLARALELLLQGESMCKTTGAPDHSLCSKTLMQVAALAREKP
ncbi:MAG: DNA polymerase III subunit delta [Pseudomonadota bacterium]